jgi:hypothetical protein
MSLLLAQSGHSSVARQCPLLGVKRTWQSQSLMSAFDPKDIGKCQETPDDDPTLIDRSSGEFFFRVPLTFRETVAAEIGLHDPFRLPI